MAMEIRLRGQVGKGLGLAAIVDDEDYPYLSQFTWRVTAAIRPYVNRTTPRDINRRQKTVFMHREILSAPFGVLVDHIDGNPLNNQRSNLRLCNLCQNMWNTRVHKDSTTGIKGVFFFKQYGKWTASIKANGKRKFLGYFADKDAAALAYSLAAAKLHGEFTHRDSLRSL